MWDNRGMLDKILGILDRNKPWKVFRHGSSIVNLLRIVGVWPWITGTAGGAGAVLITWINSAPIWARVLGGLGFALLAWIAFLVTVVAVSVRRTKARYSEIPPEEEPTLRYVNWISANDISATDLCGGNATVVEIINTSTKRPISAIGVTASVMCENDSGTRIITGNAKWYEIHRIGSTIYRPGWVSTIGDMKGGESQYFVLWISSDGKLLICGEDCNPVGELEAGHHWTITIQVTSANLNGFEARMGVEYSRGRGFEYDNNSKHFVTQRPLPPRFPKAGQSHESTTHAN